SADIAFFIHYRKEAHHFGGVNPTDNIQDKKIVFIIDERKHRDRLSILFFQKDIKISSLVATRHDLLKILCTILFYNTLKVEVFGLTDEQKFHFFYIPDGFVKHRILRLVYHPQRVVIKKE